MRTFVACIAVLSWILLIPTPASADWLLTPAASYPFGGDTVDRNRPAYGFSFGFLDEEGFGVEADLGYAPRFFDGRRADFNGSGSVLTLMGNLFVTAGRQRIAPYLVGGAGYMQMHVTSDAGTFRTTTRELGYNGGGGVIAALTDVVALRGDLRYFRSFQNQRPSWTRNVEADIAPSHFDFLRASVGLTIRVP